MKNREKFREEIVERACDGTIRSCEFTRRNVLPKFGDGVRCYQIDCAWCRFLVDLWLDEEYEESPKPEVDWDNVPVDTLVRVRNDSNTPWKLKYFRSYNPQNYHKFETWGNGATNKTTDCVVRWLFCELVEEEDDGSN